MRLLSSGVESQTTFEFISADLCDQKFEVSEICTPARPAHTLDTTLERSLTVLLEKFDFQGVLPVPSQGLDGRLCEFEKLEYPE